MVFSLFLARKPFSHDAVKKMKWALVVLLFIGARVPARTQENEGKVRPWAIQGFVVGEKGAQPESWVVVENGKFTKVGCPESKVPADARKIRHAGYLFPGLIDTHNHLTWNVMPDWNPGPSSNRYMWQEDAYYKTNISGIFYTHIIKPTPTPDLEYEGNKYGEIRAIIGGTTLLQSSFENMPPRFLIRTLDRSYGVDSNVGSIFKIKPEKKESLLEGLESKNLRRVFFHLAEGKREDEETQTEYAELKKDGFVQKGVVLIHGIGLTRDNFKEMARKGMYLVWSPVSNWNLYRETADIPAALRSGIIVSLAPDWTISGSDNLLEEMKFAEDYSRKNWKGAITPQELFKMATVNAAKVAGVEDYLGKIKEGYDADFFLVPRAETPGGKGTPKDDPFQSLLRTEPKDIRAVFVNSCLMYGEVSEFQHWFPENTFDVIYIQKDVPKALLTTGYPNEPHGTEHFTEIERNLEKALPTLAPLIEH
jgi:cytosine/adenosine deaminase-related metal-dependent hydrolase